MANLTAAQNNQLNDLNLFAANSQTAAAEVSLVAAVAGNGYAVTSLAATAVSTAVLLIKDGAAGTTLLTLYLGSSSAPGEYSWGDGETVIFCNTIGNALVYASNAAVGTSVQVTYRIYQ